MAKRFPTRAELRELGRRAWQRLRGGELTPLRAGASVAIGLAIGVMPLWGVHWLVVLAICLPLRLDAGVSYLAANVSMPLVAPFITFAELEIGARALHGAWLQVTVEEVRTLKLGNVVSEMVCGTAILATSAAIVGGATTFALASYRRRGRREP